MFQKKNWCQISNLLWYSLRGFPKAQSFDLYLTAIDWLRQEELQEVPPKNGYFQIDGWF